MDFLKFIPTHVSTWNHSQCQSLTVKSGHTIFVSFFTASKTFSGSHCTEKLNPVKVFLQTYLLILSVPLHTSLSLLYFHSLVHILPCIRCTCPYLSQLIHYRASFHIQLICLQPEKNHLEPLHFHFLTHRTKPLPHNFGKNVTHCTIIYSPVCLPDGVNIYL